MQMHDSGASPLTSDEASVIYSELKVHISIRALLPSQFQICMCERLHTEVIGPSQLEQIALQQFTLLFLFYYFILPV